jgi:FMN-dependent NADH-azoreductase
MTRILYLKASPNRQHSRSDRVARAFIETIASELPSVELDTIDVWDLALPEFDEAMLEAKFAVLRRQDATAEQQRRWSEAVRISQRFNRADLYVFSIPMWNFGIPYRLKHFIDIVTLPGENWNWSREHGYQALLSNKQAVLVASSANVHDDDVPPGFARDDFQRPYIRRWLKFIGIDVVKEIRVSPTLADPEEVKRIEAQAEDQGRDFPRFLAQEVCCA